MNPKIDTLLKLLVKKGMKEEEILKVRDDLLIKAYQTFMTEALKSLTDEDLKAIEASATQEQANEVLKKIFAEKSGKSAEEEMKRIVDETADVFIKKYSDDGLTPAEASAHDEADIAKAQDELKALSTAPPSPPEDPAETSKVSNWQ